MAETVVRAGAVVVLAAVLCTIATAQDEAGPDREPAAGAEQGQAASAPPPPPRIPESAPELTPAPTSELTPRGMYNAGLEKLRAGDHEAAVETFLAARDGAGTDPALRYRAAFNLGLALAAGAGGLTGPGGSAGDTSAGHESPEAVRETIATLRRSAAWFGDAVRLAPAGDDDARANLELVSRRILELADSLRDADRLQERLDRLIDDQRDVRDQVRRLLAEVRAEGAATEPLGFRDAYHGLASRERTLSAEVGDGIDLAAEEQLFIERTAEDERTPEQRLRVWQLTAAGRYLERARQSLGDARRRLRRLEAEPGHRRADAALADLKRAREQLTDPVTVLGAVARDEVELIAHTEILAAFARGALDLDGPPPGWLTGAHLIERQRDAADRAGEVLARFEAAASGIETETAPESAAGAGAGSASAPAAGLSGVPGDATAPATVPESAGETSRTRRGLRAAARAAPVLAGAVGAMGEAVTALEADDTATAAAAQRLALDGLRRAIEEFAGVKQLVELAHGDQQGIVGLLAPEAGGRDGLSAAEREQALLALATANERRLGRLKTLLEEEAAAARAAGAAPAKAPPTGKTETGGAGGEGRSGGAEAEARQAAERRYAHAETLRAQAVDGLRALRSELDRMASGHAGEDGGAGARSAANTTLVALDALRRLFFSIVEHLRALHADQIETHDRTAALQAERAADIEAQAAGLGLASERQQGHAHLAGALAAALAEQADAADAATGGTEAEGGADGDAEGNGAPADGPPGHGGPMNPGAGRRLAEAAEEVRKAGGRMTEAGTQLAQAAGRAASPVVEPVLETQMAAVEHLENALRALAAAEDADQEGRQAGQRQAGEAQAAEETPATDGAMSRRQALKRLQAIRDREAERHRRRQAEPFRREPVEKDW